MDRGDIKQHLEGILEYIESARSFTQEINFGDFRKSDVTKKQVYDCLREIGQEAHKLKKGKSELERDIAIDTLDTFRDINYDSETELQDQNVWNLVELDLPVIAREIHRLKIFNEKEQQPKPTATMERKDSKVE